ncbi:WGR domain-containing protein [Chitinophaga sp. Cy-1792]|uniref:WGR domain-containing protein n=1 Tax=Chitinophaga sp. Cy-1792 TaxID=2608339 RepID=UPI00141EB251|nr:WGR domain-containing protein [Chitinophaga sp. Cy-1792]NIG56298.1 WGR domain-containing protein [Chitinophaga sp. Cy-1792]
MKFVRNVKLFFREGNSDKTYEIDLCELAPDQYVVNFRYGKRGAALKEGTKTTSPVNLASATTIFDALEKEKRSKGYIGEQESEQATIPAADNSAVLDAITNPRHKAILRRLQGNPAGKNAWKTSRVIWRAGELHIKESVPYIIKQGDRKDALQRYSAIWALSRTGDPVAIPTLKAYYENSSYPLNIRMLAANGMLMLMTPEERTAFAQQIIAGMPEVLQQAIAKGDIPELITLIYNLVVVQQSPDYNILEEMYLVSAAVPVLWQAMYHTLVRLPMRPSWFRHIRHIYKQAEMREDYMIVALLVHRIQKTQPMFNMPVVYYDEHQPSVFIKEINANVKVQTELKKPGSRVAFSNLTRRYFNRRAFRNLKRLGEAGDVQYVRYATSLLLHYHQETDFSKAFEERYYGYQNGRYQSLQRQYPENSKAIYLTYILRGNDHTLQYRAHQEQWVFKPQEPDTQTQNGRPTIQPNPDLLKANENSGLLKKLFGWLGVDKQPASAVPQESAEAVLKTTVPVQENHPSIPFLELWNQLPQAFLQLLISGQMEAVHAFAMEHLRAHPEFSAMKERMGEDVIGALLANRFSIPSLFGLELAREKYNPANPSLPLLKVMIGSPLQEAREQAMEWIKAASALCFGDTGMLLDLMFCYYEDVRKFLKANLDPATIPFQLQQEVTGRAVARLMAVGNLNEVQTAILTDCCQLVEYYCAKPLSQLDMQVIADLMDQASVAVQAFAARLLLLRDHDFDFSQISNVLVNKLLKNSYRPVRDAGWNILLKAGDAPVINKPEILFSACTNEYKDIRQKAALLVERLVAQDNRLAHWLVNELVPLLMRTEKAEGMHQDIAALLSGPLGNYLQEVDTATALRLLYANYRPAQEFGVVLLQRYIPAGALTLKQVIAAGAHELLQVREWCWNFFRQQLPRVKTERDTAVALLDSKWDDTRAFAISFFRDNFQDEDWTPESLIGIADSVRPDIQQFGRELLMRFFKAEDGVQYLLKLSQHPSAAMQQFATNYLSQYAAGNLEYIRQLEHYFRAVLTRVNKARVAKDRVFGFLEAEAMKSPEAAAFIGGVITDISATVAIGDKARCISIMRNISQQFDHVQLPIVFVEAPVRLQ